MSQITINFENDKTAYRPGETMRGEVEWALPVKPAAIHIELVWSTSGKGTRDAKVVHRTKFHPSASTGRQGIELIAPEDGPYSFSGKYISLEWCIQTLAEPGTESFQQEIILSPSGREIDLYEV